jgi:hypothetical protein
MTDDGPRYAEPDEVSRQAAAWSKAILECRLYGHHWRPQRAVYHDQYRFYYLVQACPRCHTERHTELNPAGYLTKGIGRIVGDGRDALRLAAIERLYTLTATDELDERPHSRATRDDIGLVIE